MAGTKMAQRVIRRQALTAARLREVLSYDPPTGDFRWKIAANPKRPDRRGMVAGAVHPRGYRAITVDGLRCYAQQLAWLYVYGKWPAGELGFIDGDPSNNAIRNLRIGTAREVASSEDGAFYTPTSSCKSGHFSARRTSNGSCIECDRLNVAKRRAARYGSGASHSSTDIQDIGRLQKWRCAYCRKLIRCGYHVDHVVPLFLGGSDSRENLQLTCGSCNARKNSKHPIDFARKLGLLL
jgi:hypothetical protein